MQPLLPYATIATQVATQIGTSLLTASNFLTFLKDEYSVAGVWAMGIPKLPVP